MGDETDSIGGINQQSNLLRRLEPWLMGRVLNKLMSHWSIYDVSEKIMLRMYLYLLKFLFEACRWYLEDKLS